MRGLAVLILLAGCNAPRLITCDVVDGAVTVAATSLQAGACRWNGQHDKPAFFVGVGSGSIAIELAGTGTATSVAWHGAAPTVNNDPSTTYATTQPLTDGQAALWLHRDTPSTDTGSSGGGTISVTELPSAINSVPVAVTMAFTQVPVSAPPNVSVDGTVHIRVGLIPVQ